MEILTTNARSETIASYKSALARRRCLVLFSALYTWIGEKASKTKWELTLPGAEWFCFADV